MVYFFLSVLLVFGVAWVGMDLSTACRQGKGLVCVLYFMFYDYRRSAFIILHFFFFSFDCLVDNGNYFENKENYTVLSTI